MWIMNFNDGSGLSVYFIAYWIYCYFITAIIIIIILFLNPNDQEFNEGCFFFLYS